MPILDSIKKLKIMKNSLMRQIEMANQSKVPIASIPMHLHLQNMSRLMIEIIRENPILNFIDIPNITSAKNNGYSSHYTNEQIFPHVEAATMIIDTQEDILNHSAIIREDKIFITHGRNPAWRELQAYIEKDLEYPTVELSQQAYGGRSTLNKLKEESDTCRYAIILMTGDDLMGDGNTRARENVIHEIGYFQGKFGIEAVCIMYETGTNTSIPSNIDGLGRVHFSKDNIREGFGDLHREIRKFFGE